VFGLCLYLDCQYECRNFDLGWWRDGVPS